MLHKTSPQPAAANAPAAPEAAAQQQRPPREYAKFVVPLVVIGAVCVLVGISTQRFDQWTIGADVQTTDNAYIRADLSHLSARAAGNVIAIRVNDFDRVKKGDVILQIDPSDYEAKRDQAKAALDAAQAQLVNLANQENLEKAAVQQAQAQVTVAKANADLAKTAAARQATLIDRGAGIQQNKDEAEAKVQTTVASLGAAEATVLSAQAQLQYIDGQRAQLSANVQSANATLKSAQLALSYTTIVAPFDGVVSERQVHVGDYVTTGTNAISIVPLPNVFLTANFKETQLSRMREGQPVTVTVDSLPGETFHGKVSRLSPASGSQFALLPADNATGNFTKVVQRVPVRIDFDQSQALGHLRAGMSAVVSVSVTSAGL
ncbi:MAG: HlyD family secretion protein [Neorhizobium sp.]|nr:HlyD family secretion protein [Neorhizobium sp.]